MVFLHASDTDGRSLLGRFQTKAQDLEVDDHEVKVSLVEAFTIVYMLKNDSAKVEKVEEFEPGQRSYKEILESLKSCQARVYFLYAR